jgi:hypothetical protein
MKQDVRKVVFFCPTSNPVRLYKVWTLNSQNVCFYVQELGPLYCGIYLFVACVTLSNLQYSNLYSSVPYFFLSRKQNSFPETSNYVKFLKNKFIWTGIRLLSSLSTDLSLLGTAVLDSLTILPAPPPPLSDHYGDVWGRLTTQPRSQQVCNSRSQISLYLRMWPGWNLAASAVYQERPVLIKTHQPQEWQPR